MEFAYSDIIDSTIDETRYDGGVCLEINIEKSEGGIYVVKALVVDNIGIHDTTESLASIIGDRCIESVLVVKEAIPHYICPRFGLVIHRAGRKPMVVGWWVEHPTESSATCSGSRGCSSGQKRVTLLNHYKLRKLEKRAGWEWNAGWSIGDRRFEGSFRFTCMVDEGKPGL